MRVHELAKLLGVSSKGLLADMKRMRLHVKNHMSIVEEREIEHIKTIYKRRKEKEQESEEVATPTPISPSSQVSTPSGQAPAPRPRAGVPRPNLLLKTQRPTTNKAKQEAIEKARAAREIRKQTLQEKRSHRPPMPQVARLLKKKAESKTSKSAAQVEKTKPAPPSKIKPRTEPSTKKDRDKTRTRKKKKPLKPGEIIIPTIEVMSFKELKKDIAERWKKRSKGKKGVKKVEATPPQKKGGKRIRPSFYVNIEKMPAQKRQKPGRRKSQGKPRVKTVTIHGDITVEEFADKIQIPVDEVLSNLETMGEEFAPDQFLSAEYCELLSEEFDIKAEIIPEDDEHDIQEYIIEDNPESMKKRPPVVTIMGHVDHGKTTLLDSIRKSDIVSREYGGITQHIGAYSLKTSQGELVFLDTPGHEAFTAMRARGAQVTDIVVLVVAADDGVMPQTAEAINHAKAANVPIIVAINKMDKPDAQPDRVKQELMKYELLPENLGGDTLFAEVVARTGKNMEKLIELIHLQAEILELKADTDRMAEGAILESHMDPLRGVIATVLVQKGTLNTGDTILTGTEFGRVRAMIDDHGRTLENAGPSTPVELIGLTGVPSVGDLFIVLPDEKTARRIASTRTIRRRSRDLRQSRHVTLENLQSYMGETQTKELNVILKGDVQGSLEAINQSLDKISTEKVKINILHIAVGSITESDVNLADASDAIIIGFNVRPESTATELAQEQGVEVKLYRVIYDLLDEIRQAMKGLLEPKFTEVQRGRAEVRQIFKISKLGNIAGCFVQDGEINISDRARLLRDNVVVYDGTISSLRRVKENVTSVSQTLECGIALKNYNDVKEGDIIETYHLKEIPQEL